MKKLINIISIFILIAFLSCEKTIDLKAEFQDPKLVLNSLFNVDSVWKVNISRSLSVLDEGDLTSVNAAEVKLYSNGTFIEQLTSIGDNYYASTANNKPLPNTNYTVIVSASGYETIEATSNCPQKVNIVSCDTTTINNPNNGDEYEITLGFLDPVGIENYYSVHVLVQDYYVDGFDTIWYNPQFAYLNSTNPVFDQINGDAWGNELTFKDATFDGEHKTIKFRLYKPYNQGTVIKVYLNALNKDTYQYTRSYEIYKSTNGDPFAQPVQIYTNVSKGFGIFGGKNYDVKIF